MASLEKATIEKATIETFNPRLSEHLQARKRAKQLCTQLNNLPGDQHKARHSIFQELFGAISNRAFIEPNFFCDYGYNIFLGEDFFANHHCIFLDGAPIRIGNKVLLGPNVHLYATTHPLNAEERASGLQRVAPINIGDNVWIGGNSVVMPGVTIGNNVVIGAGSVVTESIPDNVIALGAPCRVVRPNNDAN